MAKQPFVPEPLPAITYTPTGEAHAWEFLPSRSEFDRMGRALDEARKAQEAGDTPVGALLVDELGNEYPAHTTEFTDQNLLSHAEMNSYKLVQERAGTYLGRYIMHTTAEPCVGCAHMLDQGEIGMLIFGASRADVPEFFNQKEINLAELWKISRRSLTVVSGLRKAESIELLTASNKKHR